MARPIHGRVRRPAESLCRVCLIAVLALAVMALTQGCGGEDQASPQAGQQGHGGNPAGGNAGTQAGRPQLPPVPVGVEPAVLGAISSYYTATATLEPNRQADILARVSGVILDLGAEEGDFVREGQSLLRIQEDEYRFRVTQSEAELNKQRSRFDRVSRMFESDLVSAEDFEAARNDLKAAESAFGLAELQLSYARVLAPFDGRIVRRYVDPGQTVSGGSILFTLVDLSRLLARVHVPSREFRRIQPDQPVELRLDSGGQRLTGKIDLISPIIDPATGTIKVTVEVHDYPAGTRPGDFAEVGVVTDRRVDTVLAPRIAVFTDRGETIAFVAAQDSTAERRAVRTGYEDERFVEVLSGIEAGDLVVVQGQRSLRHGQPLRILEGFQPERADSPYEGP